MNYSELTDFEINKLVAESIYKDRSFDHCFYGESIIDPNSIYVCSYGEYKVVDYCNNPSDAWPIILEIWDKLIFAKSDPYFGAEILWQEVIDKYSCSQLRAAMIVYLMMGDE